MEELLLWMWYSKDYCEESYRVAVLFNHFPPSGTLSYKHQP